MEEVRRCELCEKETEHKLPGLAGSSLSHRSTLHCLQQRVVYVQTGTNEWWSRSGPAPPQNVKFMNVFKSDLNNIIVAGLRPVNWVRSHVLNLI